MIYSVMIVDDEQSVIDSLQRSIGWNELQLTVVGTADSGARALEIAQRQHLDIALLDIRMPRISGLELCEKLQELNKAIQIILISGYAEFAYAEKAIQYGVVAYCLKPLDYYLVTKALQKAVRNLKKAAGIEPHLDILDIISRNQLDEVKQMLLRLGFSDASCYLAASASDRPLRQLAAQSVIIKTGRRQWVYMSQQEPAHLTASSGKESANCNCVAYLSERISPERLYVAVETCLAMSFQFFINPAIQLCTDLDESWSVQWLDQFSQELRQNQNDKAFHLLSQLHDGSYHQFTARSAMRLCNLVLSLPWISSENYLYSLDDMLHQYGDMHKMLQTLICLWCACNTETDESKFTNAAFMKLLSYINEHYKTDISLSDAAQTVHMNPNYVSQFFKKETGITFIQYINQRRITDAKSLLECTNKSVAEIATDTGFNDYFYFLKVFKKSSGVTPSQYRLLN